MMNDSQHVAKRDFKNNEIISDEIIPVVACNKESDRNKCDVLMNEIMLIRRPSSSHFSFTMMLRKRIHETQMRSFKAAVQTRSTL